MIGQSWLVPSYILRTRRLIGYERGRDLTSQGACLRGLAFHPRPAATMYRALRLLARSRRLLRVRSASAAVSGETTTLPWCTPNLARMVSGHLGPGLPSVTFKSACPRVARVSRRAAPGLSAGRHAHLPPRTPPPAECVGAAGRAEGRAPAGEPECQEGRPGQCLRL